MSRIINLGEREIVYQLERKKVKNINLRIRSDCSVYVSASSRIANSVIEEFLQKKRSYILSALDKYTEMAKYTDAKHGYVTGESFRYLGKTLRLTVTHGKNSVTSDGLYLTLSATDIDDTALKKKLIRKWYEGQCKIIFTEIMMETYPVFQKYGVAMPKLTLRSMTSRWGSCQLRKGVITLNKRLIETPRSAIQYVVMHEFVHFLCPNHSKEFYEMLSTLMPDWKARKKLLETVVFCT
jgi:predicted metal-dependent hydrolase